MARTRKTVIASGRNHMCQRSRGHFRLSLNPSIHQRSPGAQIPTPAFKQHRSCLQNLLDHGVPTCRSILADPYSTESCKREELEDLRCTDGNSKELDVDRVNKRAYDLALDRTFPSDGSEPLYMKCNLQPRRTGMHTPLQILQ